MQPESLIVAEHFQNDGPFRKLKEWLDEHSQSFDFYLVLTVNGNRNGFNYEPWHMSYRPLSLDYLKEYKELDTFSMLQKEKLVGSEYFTDDFIENIYFRQYFRYQPKTFTQNFRNFNLLNS